MSFGSENGDFYHYHRYQSPDQHRFASSDPSIEGCLTLTRRRTRERQYSANDIRGSFRHARADARPMLLWLRTTALADRRRQSSFSGMDSTTLVDYGEDIYHSSQRMTRRRATSHSEQISLSSAYTQAAFSHCKTQLPVCSKMMSCPHESVQSDDILDSDNCEDENGSDVMKFFPPFQALFSR